MSSMSDDEIREVAREAARAEVWRVVAQAIYFVAGIVLLFMSAAAFSTIGGWTAVTGDVIGGALGVFFLVGGVYLLAYVFDLDLRVARWVNRHLPGAR